MQTVKVKVLVVESALDEQRPIREACTIDPALQIVGYARTPGSGAAVAHAAAPDVILYDPSHVAVPRALDAIDELRQAAAGAPIVLYADRSRTDHGLLAGSAEAVVPKHHPELLPRMIRSLAVRGR